MSDSEDNIMPFQLPENSGDSGETLRERLRRRRKELVNRESQRATRNWQSRKQTLTALVVGSPHESATIARKNGSDAASQDGIKAVLFSGDIPAFQNTLGREYSSEPLLAEEEVHYEGQPVALIIGEDEASCLIAASRLDIEYHTDTGILTLEQALAMESFHAEPRTCERGDADGALATAANQVKGAFSISPQLVAPPHAGELVIRPMRNGSSLAVETNALLPTLVRSAVASAANLPESEVHLESHELPGLTGALETAPVRLAALATHAVLKCGSAIRIALDSTHSPLHSGLRHEARAAFEAGYEDDGTITAVRLRIALDGGWYEGDSSHAMDRALLHSDAVYRIPNLALSTRLAKTNRVVCGSLPAEGAAQGTWAMEEVIERVAEASGIAPHLIREKNFYDDVSEPKNTPYGQPVHGPSIQRIWHQAMGRSDFEERRASLASWNRKNAGYKRGISAFPVKFGVGDPRAERNAAAVIVQILADGSVTVRAGLVDLNDGLNHQIQEEVASKLGVEESAIHVILNDFDSLPRATPVTGTDAAGLVLRALDDACKALLHRLREVALQLFAAKGQTEVELESIRFSRGVVGPDITPTDPLHFKEVIEGAWRKRVNLIETGYHRTPNLWWDPELGAGWPFSSFTYAVAVTEIQVDAFTGEIQILRLDVVHEGSPSPNQHDRDFAQLMRAYQLGHGWMLQNSAPTPDQGQSSTPDHRGVPGLADAPFQINSDRLRPLGHPMNIPGDPCGEAPVVLAGSIRSALRDALHSFGLDSELNIEIPLPATPPSVLATFKEISTAVREREEGGKKKA